MAELLENAYFLEEMGELDYVETDRVEFAGDAAPAPVARAAAPAAPKHRLVRLPQRAAAPADLLQDPRFLEQLDELDEIDIDAIEIVSEPTAVVTPLPELRRIVPPRPKVEACDLMESQTLMEHLDELDCLLGDTDALGVSAPQPSVLLQLATPTSSGGWKLQGNVNAKRASFSAASAAEWVTSACLVLLILTGAAGATVAFHERLSVAVSQLLK